MRWLLILLTCLAGERAAARAGTGDANTKYQNTKSLDGFCTDTNQDEPYYKEGYCQSLAEQFNKNDCMKDTLEKLRQRIAGTSKEKNADGTRKTMSAPFSCTGDGHFQTITKLAETNPSKFSYVMMQWFSMLVAQHSGWDVLKGEDQGGKGPNGLLDLNLEKGGDKDMENKKYECGCKEGVVTTSGQSGVTAEGQSPGPLDGHHSMTCGSYMVFKSMLDDNQADGNESDPDKPNAPKKPKGVTKILPDVGADTYNDPKAEKSADWRQKKMETFCKQFWKSSTTDPWNRELTNDIDGSQLQKTAPKSDTSQ